MLVHILHPLRCVYKPNESHSTGAAGSYSEWSPAVRTALHAADLWPIILQLDLSDMDFLLFYITRSVLFNLAVFSTLP